MTALHRFYLIVDHTDWLKRLLPLGVRFVQLRIKDRPLDAVRGEIALARKLCLEAGAQLIVNDYWRIAIEEGCDFIHLGQEDLQEADLGAIRAAGMKLGVSTHDDAELETALAVRPDYVALGPVWPTILKKMPWAPQGVARVSEWKRRLGQMPLVAIGGLTPERAREVWAAGAESAAVVTDVLRAADPEARVREWLQAAEAA
ncbi:thiamine phosphate synthase [Acetobacteraceae bacterium H6797]|nr:thiamine phosphate synthase [Acetobacteraceae bacterium H6797]